MPESDAELRSHSITALLDATAATSVFKEASRAFDAAQARYWQAERTYYLSIETLLDAVQADYERTGDDPEGSELCRRVDALVRNTPGLGSQNRP
jgi:hypothetical protein